MSNKDKDQAKTDLAELADLVVGNKFGEEAVKRLERYLGEQRRSLAALKAENEGKAQSLMAMAKLAERVEAAEAENKRLKADYDTLLKRAQRVEAKSSELEQWQQAFKSRPNLVVLRTPDDHRLGSELIAENSPLNSQVWEPPPYTRSLILGERIKADDQIWQNGAWISAKAYRGQRFLGDLFHRQTVRLIPAGPPSDADFNFTFDYFYQFLRDHLREVSSMLTQRWSDPAKAPVCMCCGASETQYVDVNGQPTKDSFLPHRDGCWVLSWTRTLRHVAMAMAVWMSARGRGSHFKEVGTLLREAAAQDQAAIEALYRRNCLTPLNEVLASPTLEPILDRDYHKQENSFANNPAATSGDELNDQLP